MYRIPCTVFLHEDYHMLYVLQRAAGDGSGPEPHGQKDSQEQHHGCEKSVENKIDFKPDS